MSRSMLDRTDILNVLFHPRRISILSYSTPGIRLVDVEVGPEVTLGGRLYPAERLSPIILYFHGNGEIAADYDDIASVYTQMGVSLLVTDYRGYGRSTGYPSADSLLSDAVVLYQALDEIFAVNDLAPSGRYVMGRSLGSAAALEAAFHAGQELNGLIIESGFADTFELLGRLGVEISWADDERDGFGNLSKISQIETPTLVIHGEWDVLIPPEDGQQLFERCAAAEKRLMLIPSAGHNDLMAVGAEQYFNAIRQFIFEPHPSESI